MAIKLTGLTEIGGFIGGCLVDSDTGLMMASEGGAGSDPQMLKTRARRDGEDWVIDGRKAFITGADGARMGIVMAMADEGATMFLVDLPHPVVQIERVLPGARSDAGEDAGDVG